MTYLSLFSGIGGFELGLERAGMEVIWNSEIEPFPCEVLKRRWPDVPNLGDITKIDWNTVPRVDVICGGFPCQDISVAGKQKGIKDDTRSGLWFYFRDAISALRPRYAIIENVAGLYSSNKGRDFARVLHDLAEIGYDAEWARVSAAATGAHHRRWRVFIVAYPDTVGWDGGSGEQWQGRRGEPQNSSRDMGNTDKPSEDSFTEEGGSWGSVGESGWWAVEPDVGRVADGVPNRLDRLRGLGNAVVPQVAEWVGRRIVAGLE